MQKKYRRRKLCLRKQVTSRNIHSETVCGEAAHIAIIVTTTIESGKEDTFANKEYIMARRKEKVTIDDVHNETLALFRRLIQRLEKLTHDCEDPGTINQALKTTADFLVKLNKEREQDDDNLDQLLRQTLKGVEDV